MFTGVVVVIACRLWSFANCLRAVWMTVAVEVGFMTCEKCGEVYSVLIAGWYCQKCFPAKALTRQEIDIVINAMAKELKKRATK